jgi:hypothetical protein
MNKRTTTTRLVVTLLLTLLPACTQSAPSVANVSSQCVNEHRQSGQTVALAGTEYVCPSPSPTPKPVENVTNTLLDTTESLCKENGNIWQNPSNAEWLAQNVVSPVTSWKYEDGQWVYTYVPEFITLTFGGYTQKYAESFMYPRFGVFTVSLYEGGTTMISQPNQSTWLNFTKLELSCP